MISIGALGLEDKTQHLLLKALQQGCKNVHVRGHMCVHRHMCVWGGSEHRNTGNVCTPTE